MAKYIDAAAFVGGTLTISESQLRFREMTGQEAYFEFLRMANDAPAADVEPVVYAKRLEVDGETICGECRKSLVEVGLYERSPVPLPRCPFCGARMDGGTE